MDTRQVETLMARGVAPKDAVNILVRGMMGPWMSASADRIAMPMEVHGHCILLGARSST